MPSKMRCFLLLFLLFSGLVPYAQQCAINDSTDWQQVELRVMEKKNQKDIDIMGESFVKVSSTIHSLADLSEAEIAVMKKNAAKYGYCIVYVDIAGHWDNPAFPHPGELYYYFGNPKQ